MKIACIGYGIDQNRTEAVSINTIRLISDLHALGHEVVLLNIGHESGISFSSSMTESLLHRRKILEKLKIYLDEHKIEIVIDVFVLPFSSYLFTIPLKKHFHKVTFIKEMHNPPGFSGQLHSETLIRLLANNRVIHEFVARSFDKVFTRNVYLARERKYAYLPSKVEIHPLNRGFKSNKVCRVGYIGHPLVKKGVAEFINLIKILPKESASRVEFHFAFSSLGNKTMWESKLAEIAQKKGVTIKFHGKVKPWLFLRKLDVFILPIHDDFGAISTPNTVLEAMEAGAVVLVTTINSLKGVIDHQRNGILLDSYGANHILPALQTVLYDEALRAKLAHTARQDCSRHHAPLKVKQALSRLLWQKKQHTK